MSETPATPSLVDTRRTLSGLEFFQRMAEGALEPPAMVKLLGLRLVVAEKGRVVFTGVAAEQFYNGLGVAHGGFAATMLDSALGCAINTMQPAGRLFTTLELKINYTRPLTREAGELRCEATVFTRAREPPQPRHESWTPKAGSTLTRRRRASWCRRPTMATPLTLADLVVRPDEPIATSDWLDVTQSQIDAFATVTRDEQWIHTDPVRAAQSPFGTTIAHGFLTLSLLTQLMTSAFSVAGASMLVNYGLDRVRFTAPVPAGSRIRARVAVGALTTFGGGVQVTWHVTIENDRARRPCALVEWLVRYYGITPCPDTRTGTASLSDALP